MGSSLPIRGVKDTAQHDSYVFAGSVGELVDLTKPNFIISDKPKLFCKIKGTLSQQAGNQYAIQSGSIIHCEGLRGNKFGAQATGTLTMNPLHVASPRTTGRRRLIERFIRAS